MNVDSIPEEQFDLCVGVCHKLQFYRMSEVIGDRFFNDEVTGTPYAMRASYSNLSPFVYPNS